MAFDLFAADGGKRSANKALAKPVKLSYTSFKRAQQCSAMYAMANVLYWIPKTVNNRNFCLGSVLHTCMERWIKEGELQPGFMEGIAQEEYDRYLRDNTVIPLNSGDLAQMRTKSVTNAKALEETFTEYGLFDKTLLSEKKWTIPLPGRPRYQITGTLDLFVKEDNTILDLKTTTSTTFMDETQLVLYAMMGVLSGLKTTKAGFIVPLRKEKLVTMTFEPADFTALLHDFQDTADSVEESLHSGQWEFKYNKSACYRCQVNSRCEEYNRQTGPADLPTEDHGNGRVIKFS